MFACATERSNHVPDRPRTRDGHHQRRIITKLKNNPAATELVDLSFDGSPGAVFEIPAELISFRSGRRKLTEAQRTAAVANLDQARRAAWLPLFVQSGSFQLMASPEEGGCALRPSL
jgi:hypothetical protein